MKSRYAIYLIDLLFCTIPKILIRSLLPLEDCWRTRRLVLLRYGNVR